MKRFTNTPCDALRVGMQAELRRVCRSEDLYVFANASGNINPMHLPHEDGDGDGDADRRATAPSMWVASSVSAVLGNLLPGPGTLLQSQSMRFVARVFDGDDIVSRVILVEKLPGRVVRFATSVHRADGLLVAEGEAEVLAPLRSISFDASDVPGLTVRRHAHFEKLLAKAEPLAALRTAVAAPEDANSLGGALLAAKHTLITPILVGNSNKIRAVAAEIGADVSGVEIIEAASHDEAAARAVALVHEGKAQAVMKGFLHTEQLLHHVVKREGGLRTARRLSHVFVMDVPGSQRLLMVTDAVVNIAPDLEAKADIIQNAIDLARALGIKTPRVAVLSALELVNARIASTLDAAILSKMADRGQIAGGQVDGPLGMDNAIDLAAAKTKGIKSNVAGRADILAVPGMEAGNMLAKQLTFSAHAEAAGLVVGAKCPIILTSRADNDAARLASCAVAALYAKWCESR